MIDLSILPIWAYGYIFLLCGFTFAGFFIEKHTDRVVAAGQVLTLFISIVCILAYCQPVVVQKIGVYLFAAMIIVGLVWDFVDSVRDANYAEQEMKHEHDITEDERVMIMNMGFFFGACLILPAYMMGLKVCYDFIILGTGG